MFTVLCHYSVTSFTNVLRHQFNMICCAKCDREVATAHAKPQKLGPLTNIDHPTTLVFQNTIYCVVRSRFLCLFHISTTDSLLQLTCLLEHQIRLPTKKQNSFQHIGAEDFLINIVSGKAQCFPCCNAQFKTHGP